MSDLSEEVDRFVGGISGDDEPKRKRKAKAAAAPPPPEDPPEEDPPEDEEEDEEEEDPASLIPRELPRPAETAKSLAGMMTKYQIGDDPDFSVQLHRLLPKFLPGGVQGHGYLDEYRQPISEDYISKEYGGGTYMVRVFGPDPKNPPNGQRQYDSIKVECAGAPNPERLSRSAQAKRDASSAAPSNGGVVGPPMVHQENPELAKQGMKMAEDAAKREREDRLRAEDNASKAVAQQRQLMDPLIEAERRRADELVKAERERSQVERQALEDRLREQREETKRLADKVDAMQAGPQRNLAEDLKDMAAVFKGDGEATAAAVAAVQKSSDTITQSILDKHRGEIESLNKQNQITLESIRSAHVQEVASLREAGIRELAAEREAGRVREQRHEEALKAEREERRRDAELYKKTESERDKQWRDRMEDQELRLKSLWESRVETQKTSYESQISWLRSENEQAQARIRNFEAQQADRGDLVKQLSSMRDLRSVAKDALGIDDAPQPSAGGGGIGLSGGEGPGSWKELFETAIENAPAILQQWNAMGPTGPTGAPQQMVPQQQTPQPGQIIQTPQGPMVIVVDPSTGQLAQTPKAQYDAYVAQQAQQRTSRPAMGAGPKPRGVFAPPAGPRPKPSSGLPVPDMSVGLPKPRPWGEPVEPPLPDAQPQQRPQAPAQQASAAPQQRGSVAQQPMDQTKKLIAKEVAKLVHKSVDGGEEPEEFVHNILTGGFPEPIVRTIAGMTDDEVIAGIREAEPNSAGATPMGQRFVREALGALREALNGGT